MIRYTQLPVIDDEYGTPHFGRCPSTRSGKCGGDYQHPSVPAVERKACSTYVCPGCDKRRPWCDGGSDSPLCDTCWCRAERRKQP